MSKTKKIQKKGKIDNLKKQIGIAEYIISVSNAFVVAKNLEGDYEKFAALYKEDMNKINRMNKEELCKWYIDQIKEGE